MCVTDELSPGNALGMWSGRFLHSASIYPRLPLKAALLASPNAKPEGMYDSFGKKKKGKERALVCCVLLCCATWQGQTFERARRDSDVPPNASEHRGGEINNAGRVSRTRKPSSLRQIKTLGGIRN